MGRVTFRGFVGEFVMVKVGASLALEKEKKSGVELLVIADGLVACG